MAATAAPQAAAQWGSIRATRTKAMPKTTLFGSALEIQTTPQRQEMATINLNEVDKEIINASRPKQVKLGDVDKSKIPG